ncbi:hypothetical protein K443DRAFT_5176 [Laccaria amethystina LaAM-08-1]|uniref:Zn(2)-C6 fungal-type domain-containing protein n=1 Tax=Laccaria amethystina LaAM-08-1 TaxID=1095629 RepID=A0A0C9Y6K1_9AGAR|nr:hypothetical protein K443DRAFT_5176 [Laccaria amethystina LaAM-08-1]
MNQSGQSTSRPLARGSACISCRRRKVKCDGVRPVCGPCENFYISKDCEYGVDNTRTQTEILEDQISHLEERINRRMNPVASSSRPITLHNPYSSRTATNSPPPDVVERLLEAFLTYCSGFGFFLHIARFRASMLLSLPAGHPSRPSPALIYSTYLLGLFFLGDASLQSQEQYYLTKATREATTSSSGSHPSEIIHGIQAEVLLAYYSFMNNRQTEAKYHTTAAVSLTLGAGLHKIRSRNAAQGYRSPLHSPSNSVEEGERIRGFWSVFILDHSLSSTLGETPNMTFPPDKPDAALDTPWPLDMDDYELGRFPGNIRTDKTLVKFFSGQPTSDSGSSRLAIHAKASCLWDRVESLARAWTPGTPYSQFSAFSAQFSSLDAILDTIKASLPNLTQIPGITDPEEARQLLICYSIIHMCIIKLQGILAEQSANSKAKKLDSAKNIMQLVVAVEPHDLLHLTPIIHEIWAIAAHLVMDEIGNLGSQRAQRGWASQVSLERETALSNLVRQALTVVSSLSANCPLSST